MSMRTGKKLIIAAVNGLAYSGGCEIVVNADLVFASPNFSFVISEVKVDTIAYAGVLPRLISILGLQRATKITLTGRAIEVVKALK